jgi:regulator of replication initiation timing
MSIENIIALTASLGAIISAIWTARSTATKAELESLRKTIVSLQGQNDRLTVENDKLRDRVGDLEKKSAAQDDAAQCLVDRVKQLESENSLLKLEIDALKHENTRLSSDNAKLRARVAELEKGKGSE